MGIEDRKQYSYGNEWILTLVIAASDAVLHFAIEPRVLIAGPEGTNPRSGLAFRHLERPLIGSGESGCHIVHVQDIYHHLRRK